MVHVLFIPYGIKDQVDLLIRDMQSQKFKLRMWKEGEKEQFIYVQGSLRILPFGVYDYVFPREALPHVLSTLKFDKPAPYNIGKGKLYLMRKVLGVKAPPKKIDDSEVYLWITQYVSIIPVGIKEDLDMIETGGSYPGWSHEML